MKKNFFLTLMLAVLCTATSWAESPADGVYTIAGDANLTRGYMCAGEGYANYPVLTEITYSGCTGNSVNAVVNGKNWYVTTKADGTYIYNLGLDKYLVKDNDNINFGDTPYAWTIQDNGNFKAIYDAALGKYLSMGCGRSAADRPIAWDTNAADGGAKHTFTAVANGATTFATQIAEVEAELAALIDTDPYVLLKSPSGTYLSIVAPSSTSTKLSFQAEGTKFLLENVNGGTGYYIRVKDAEPATYVAQSTSNAWDCTTSTTPYTWFFSEPDDDGFITISDDSGNLGHDTSTSAGTGIFANVGDGCNKWYIEEYNVGSVTYTFQIENPSGQAVSATYNSGAITDGATIEVEGSVNTALFSANEITGYTWKIVVNVKAKKITLVYVKKYTISLVNAPNGVSITYNGNAIADGGFMAAEYDTRYLSVNGCPNGYTWEITINKETKVVTVTFAQMTGQENPQAVVDLLNRIGGEGTADKFKIVLDPSLNYAADQFSINGENGKVLIKGTNISAITAGIGWYLQYYAKINIAWNSLNEKTVSGAAYADLSYIPVPTDEEVHTSDAQYRYFFNTCTFGYSMTSWTWKRWQQEIDWMALHGINMPLQLVGMEEVWRKFLTMEENGKRKYGYTDEAAKAFVAGPAFIAWWAMNNLEGWGGTAAGTKSGGTWEGAGGVQDDAWYARQKKLAKQICDRQRELGMQPVLPGWSGMVPTNFASKSGFATRGNGGNWAGDFVRPLLLSVSNANYAEIAADYYACLKEVMGESQYYSMDPFHEGGGAGTMEDYEALYAAMEAAKPGSQWVIQQWQWNDTQKYSLTAVPAGRLIVLDLFSDGSPAFDGYNGYAPQDAVFCAIPNFGGRSGLMGRLTNLTDNYFKFKSKYASIKGIGAAPEAIEQTPVTYDLIFQLPWMNGVKPDVAEWVDNYAIARYGVNNDEIKDAWSLLRQGPLNYGADGIQGPVEDVWAARPNLTANPASYWGKTMTNAIGTYTKARHQMLIDATYKLLAQNDEITGEVYRSNYLYDLVEFGGGVLADYAYYLLKGINAAKTTEGTSGATYTARKDAFLQLILDVDAFKGTNLNFRLGKWTQEARAAAAEVEGATTATPDWYEYNNARTIVSTWSSPNTNLNDYSYRSWQGLMKDLYYPRWKHYFDNGCTTAQYGYFEWNWAHGKEHYVGQTAVSNVALTADQAGHTSSYTRDPQGNTVEKAAELLGKYIIPIKADNGTYYAYRHLGTADNAFTAAAITVVQGSTIDLSSYFGNLTADGKTVTVASEAFEDTSNFAATTVKSGIAGNSKTATVTISDGTAFTFTVNVVTDEYYTEKAALATLIDNMKALTAQVGTYNTVGKITEIALTTTQGQNGYIWCSNPHQSGGDAAGGVAALLDEDNATYLHTNYSNVSATNDFLQVELGDGNGLARFMIGGVQRTGAQADLPKTIEVLGSTDGSSWNTVSTVNDIPQTAGAEWKSDAIVCVAQYPYLKFVVTTGNNRKYFHMAKFDLYKVETTATVLAKYDGTELTNEFAAAKYDVLLDAIAVYESTATEAEITAAKEALQTAYDELFAKTSKVFNGVYNIVYNGKPVFIAYSESPVLQQGPGYELYDGTTENGNPTAPEYVDAQTKAINGMKPADALIIIAPNGESTGYTLSVQGLYMKTTKPDDWASQSFDSNEEQAGVYLFEEVETDVYKLKSNAQSIQYVYDWGHVFGNNEVSEGVVSTYEIVPVTKYTLTVPANGATTLCLPFNVVLPAGVTAYDLTKENITADGDYKVYQLATVATEGQTLAKNTPVIIKADEGDYTLAITMDGEGAKVSTEGSVLRSGLVKTTVAAGNNYTFDGVDFNIVTANAEIAANQCWMELDENLGTVIYKEAPATVVRLTTDEANPILYKIIIKRADDDSKVLRYDNNDDMVAVGGNNTDKTWQAWYFMQGDNGITIHPFNANGKVLGADNTSNGSAKVWAVEKGSKEFYEWKLIPRDNGYYNIQAHDESNYFSNNGGEGNKMGFWSGSPETDGGSLFKFIEAEFTNDNAHYYQLSDMKSIITANVYGGTSVGLYTMDAVTAYREGACATAQELIDAGSDTSSSADCYAAYQALLTGKAALAYNAPAANKVYYIVSTASGDDRGYCTGKYVHTYTESHVHTNATWGNHTYDQRHLLFDNATDISQLSLAAFQFEETGTVGSYKMKNLHTGLYVKSFNKDAEHLGAEADAQVVTLVPVTDGQVALKIGNNNPMHAQNDYSVIVSWTAEPNNPSTWTINEATNLDEIYKLTVPESGFATLNLAFNVVLPEGVTAYDFVESDIAQAEGGDRKEFMLTTVATDGEVLAKNTPVIIKAIAGEYNFKATFSNDNVKNGTTGSVLRGNYWQTTVGTDVVNYLPAVVDNGLAFNKVTADNTVVTANTVWAVLSTADNGATIYEYVPAPEAPTVEIAAGKVYRIKNYTVNTPDEYKYHYLVNSNVSIAFPTSVEDDDKSAMWVCTSADADTHKYTFVSALGTASFGWQGVAEDALEYTISDGTIAGTVTLANGTTSLALTTEAYNNSGKVAFNQASNGVKVQHADHWSTDWYLEEVENHGVCFTKSISTENKWATMYLPYAVTIPAGIEVYYAAIDAIEGKMIDLTPLTGTIPAKTAVLLHRAEAAVAEDGTPEESTASEYTFALTDDVSAVENLFEGKIMQTAISSANARVYLLINYNKKEAFYWMADEYNSSCVFAGLGSGFVKCDANKCYFKIEENVLSPASSYSFRYDGTTGIDEIESEKVKAIYDLQGRKLGEITQPGMYIVNGEKMWVK